MNRLLSILFVCAVLMSCNDETLDNMNENDQKWTDVNTGLSEAEAKIEAILSKYNAKSFKVIIDKTLDETEKHLKFYDSNQKLIENIAKEDAVAFYDAYVKIEKKEVEMSQLSDADEVFTVVEQPPSPEGGIEALYSYIGQNLKYPKMAKNNGIEGKVFVQFIITEFGEVTNVEVLKGIGSGCDEEAARVIKNMAQWAPGKQRGQAVNVKMVLPISFKLS